MMASAPVVPSAVEELAGALGFGCCGCGASSCCATTGGAPHLLRAVLASVCSAFTAFFVVFLAPLVTRMPEENSKAVVRTPVGVSPRNDQALLPILVVS